MNGWAVESRLYAEDPYRNFLPSIGRLTRYRPPEEGRFGEIDRAQRHRRDRGVGNLDVLRSDDRQALHLGADARCEAIDAMSDALDGFVVDGIQHNIPFLTALMQHPRWREGRLSTGFIAEEYPDGFPPVAARTPTRRRCWRRWRRRWNSLRRDRLDRLSGRLAPHSGRLKPRLGRADRRRLYRRCR